MFERERVGRQERERERERESEQHSNTATERESKRERERDGGESERVQARESNRGAGERARERERERGPVHLSAAASSAVMLIDTPTPSPSILAKERRRGRERRNLSTEHRVAESRAEGSPRCQKRGAHDRFPNVPLEATYANQCHVSHSVAAAPFSLLLLLLPGFLTLSSSQGVEKEGKMKIAVERATQAEDERRRKSCSSHQKLPQGAPGARERRGQVGMTLRQMV
eukprot:3940362-Rhodomonas_salina.1